MRGFKETFPGYEKPMLCTISKVVPKGGEWIHEIKWDGYRIMAYVSKHGAALKSRNLQDYTTRFAEITEALEELGHEAVLDGEVTVLDNEGRPNFNMVQNYDSRKSAAGDIYFYCFDVLWLDGKDLRNVPLIERKKILQGLLDGNDIIRYNDHFENGEALLEQIKLLGLEGIVSKKKKSVYRYGVRSKDWLKNPLEQLEEFVIGGWEESDKNRYFKSLLFGRYVNGKFVYIGHTGGGYTDKEMRELYARLQKIEVKKMPFTNKVETDGKAHWVKPIIVVSIKFASWTEKGKIRKPAIYKGLREDIKPKEIVHHA